MFKHLRLAGATAFFSALCLPALAEPDPTPGFAEFFSINRIGTALANQAIIAARTQMELEYDFMATDVMRGSVSISGITARPQLPHDQARQCTITVDRAMFDSDLAQPFEVSSELTINLIGTKISTACLPREAAMGVRAAGMRDIELDQFQIRGAYLYPTGETSADVSIQVNGFASIDFSASGMILPRKGQFGSTDPAIRVLRSVLSVKDQGGWARVSALLPEAFRDPAMINALGTEALLQELNQNGTRAVTAMERNFVSDLMAQVEAFIAESGELTLEADLPPTGIVIEPEVYNDEPEQLITTLALQARKAPLARSHILETDQLRALLAPEELTAEERLTLAQALLDGVGVPQSPALVPELLDPVFENAALAPEAAALTARALRLDAPADAYAFALLAAENGQPQAVSLLDQLEAQLGSVQVLEIQQEQLADAPPAAEAVLDDDPRSLRKLSLSYLTGNGVTRSYARAYYYALLAEAAGDIGASILKKEIDARFDARGQEVALAWNRLSADLQAEALRDWIEGDLAGRYMTE